MIASALPGEDFSKTRNLQAKRTKPMFERAGCEIPFGCTSAQRNFVSARCACSLGWSTNRGWVGVNGFSFGEECLADG